MAPLSRKALCLHSRSRLFDRYVAYKPRGVSLATPPGTSGSFDHMTDQLYGYGLRENPPPQNNLINPYKVQDSCTFGTWNVWWFWGEGFSYWVWRVPLQGSHISHQLKRVKGCVIVPRRVYKGFFPPSFPVFAWWLLSLAQLNKCRMNGACLPLESRKHQAAVIFESLMKDVISQYASMGRLYIYLLIYHLKINPSCRYINTPFVPCMVSSDMDPSS